MRRAVIALEVSSAAGPPPYGGIDGSIRNRVPALLALDPATRYTLCYRFSRWRRGDLFRPDAPNARVRLIVDPLNDLLLRGVVMERVIKPTVRGEPTDEARLARILEQSLPPELDYLETRVNGPFLIGSQLSIADLALVTAFVNARYAGYEVDAERWPGLSEYVTRQLGSPLFERRLEHEAAYLASMTPR